MNTSPDAGDAGNSNGDGGSGDGGSDAGTEANFSEITVDRVLPDIAPSSNKPVVGAGVADTVPTCPAGQFACNGVCLSSETPAAEASGCRLIDGKFFSFGLHLEGDVAYGAGERNEASGRVAGLYRVALDGSGATLLAQLSNTSLRGIHQDRLIFEYESCPGQSRYTSCLGTLPIAGGTPSPLFAGLHDTHVIIAGGKALYRANQVGGAIPVYERTLFEGEPVFRFASNNSGGLAQLSSNGDYAYFSRDASGPDDEYLLTKLGAPGTTVQLAKAFSNPFTSVFFVGEYLYLVRRIGNEGAHYQRLKLGAETGEALAELPVLPSGIAVGGDAIYFRAFTEAAVDRIYRMPLLGGTITPVATFKQGDLGGFAANGNALYVRLQLGSTAPLVRVRLP